MLTKINQQKCLKYLGYYTGEINGKESPLYRKAVKDLQDDYFTRRKDRDGIYGHDTDILLVNAYRVKKYTKNFTLEEFRCECDGDCTGYPVKLSIQLLKNLQKVRDKYGAVTITSGLRCKTYNNKLSGSSPTSRHMKGKALDIYCAKTRTKDGRAEVKNYVRKLTGHNYTYSDTIGMGNAVHFDVV